MVLYTHDDSRYDACRILQQNSIPCVVWSKDALGHYDDTIGKLRGLHLLVPSTYEAAKVMLQRGWKPVETFHDDLTDDLTEDRTYWSSMFKDRERHLRPPEVPFENMVTPQPKLLLQAAEYWQFPLEILAQGDFIPPLATLTDSFIMVLLYISGGTELHSVLVTYVRRMYDKVEGMREPGFAEKLNPLNRRFHEEALSGMMDLDVAVLTQRLTQLRLAREKLKKEMNEKGDN